MCVCLYTLDPFVRSEREKENEKTNRYVPACFIARKTRMLRAKYRKKVDNIYEALKSQRRTRVHFHLVRSRKVTDLKNTSDDEMIQHRLLLITRIP